MAALAIDDCVVLHGPELAPRHCTRVVIEGGTIAHIGLGPPCNALTAGAIVVIPGLTNAHTHMGDSVAPDGATGMTLEEGFFRPAGFKYRTLAAQDEPSHLEAITGHLRYMARTGTVRHIDFREQGAYGSQLLRRASQATGVRSVILGQFNELPFSTAELRANRAGLSGPAMAEMAAVLDIADGFSESTMNDLTDPAWSAIAGATRQRGKLRAIHVLENDGYRSESLAISGRGDLERALDLFDPHLLIHATVANDDEIALMSGRRCNVALNPRANANLGLPIPPVAKLMRAGINLLLGTDNGLLNSPNMLAELDYAYKIAKSQFGDARSPDPVSILKMATSNVGALLGPDTPGYLAEGLPADCVLLDFRAPHLRQTRHIVASVVTRVTPADVMATLHRGRLLWQDGNVTRDILRPA
jgi:cytosine/adenosine deaminase-related metal-dependent hydrolase